MTSLAKLSKDASSARHSVGASKSISRIVWDLFVRLKWQYYPLLLSDYGREILRRKYDAFATDRAYENRPSGLLGPIGRWIDRIVLDFPTHEGLRQRLRIVVDALKEDITERIAAGETPVRVLSAPCGLARDILTCKSELRNRNPQVMQHIELHALDLDATGDVLPAATRRAADLGIDVEFHREDLFNSKGLNEVLERGEGFHLVNCIGLTAWLDIEEVGRLVRFFHDRVLVTDGTLIVDNFAWHKYSSLAKDLEIYTRYHDPGEFKRTLEECGFQVLELRTTADRVNTVHIARSR